MTTSQFLSLSFVVPVYRGEKYLPSLVGRLDALRTHLEQSTQGLRVLEAIFVCDEPVDGSAATLTALAATRPWVTVLHLAKNSGQHGATAAGMLHTSGDWVITIDEDGQHDPFNALELMGAALPQHFDLCYAKPTAAVHTRWWRNASSRLAKRFTAWLVNDPYVSWFNSFRLVRGEIARAAGALAAHDLYLDVALRWLTDRLVSAPLEMHDPRTESGYRFRTLVSHFRKLLMAYHPPFLRWLPALGLLSALGFGLLGVVAAVAKLLWPDVIPVQGWTSLFVLTAFSTGVMVFLFGFLLERLSSTMSRAQGKPAFLVVDRSKDALWQKPAATAASATHATV